MDTKTPGAACLKAAGDLLGLLGWGFAHDIVPDFVHDQGTRHTFINTPQISQPSLPASTLYCKSPSCLNLLPTSELFLDPLPGSHIPIVDPYPEDHIEQRDRRLTPFLTGTTIVASRSSECVSSSRPLHITPPSAVSYISPTTCGAGLAGLQPKRAKMPQSRLYSSYGRRSTCYRNESDI